MHVLEPLSASRYLLRMSVGCQFKDKLERARDLMSHGNPSGELAIVLERALDLLVEKLEKQRFAQTKRARSGIHVRLGCAHDRRAEPSESAGVAQNLVTSSDTTLAPSLPRPVRASQVEGSTATVETVCADAEALAPGAVWPFSPAIPATVHPEAPAGAKRPHIPNAVRRAVAKRDNEQCTYIDHEGRRCPSRSFLQLHHERAHALGGPSTFENLRLLCGAHNRLLAEQDFGRAHQMRCISRQGLRWPGLPDC